jgi:flagellar biosynthesis GTPase FlhF
MKVNCISRLFHSTYIWEIFKYIITNETLEKYFELLFLEKYNIKYLMKLFKSDKFFTKKQTRQILYSLSRNWIIISDEYKEIIFSELNQLNLKILKREILYLTILYDNIHYNSSHIKDFLKHYGNMLEEKDFTRMFRYISLDVFGILSVNSIPTIGKMWDLFILVKNLYQRKKYKLNFPEEIRIDLEKQFYDREKTAASQNQSVAENDQQQDNASNNQQQDAASNNQQQSVAENDQQQDNASNNQQQDAASNNQQQTAAGNNQQQDAASNNQQQTAASNNQQQAADDSNTSETHKYIEKIISNFYTFKCKINWWIIIEENSYSKNKKIYYIFINFNQFTDEQFTNNIFEFIVKNKMLTDNYGKYFILDGLNKIKYTNFTHEQWKVEDILQYYSDMINCKNVNYYTYGKIINKLYRNFFKFYLRVQEKYYDINLHIFLFKNNNISYIPEYFSDKYFYENKYFMSKLFKYFYTKFISNEQQNTIINSILEYKWFCRILYRKYRKVFVKYCIKFIDYVKKIEDLIYIYMCIIPSKYKEIMKNTIYTRLNKQKIYKIPKNIKYII